MNSKWMTIVEEGTDVVLKECSRDAFGEIVIPDGVTKIGKQAFIGCKNLKSVIMPNSVVKIDDEAFKECESLNHIIIPKGVTEIADGSFAKCKSLETITLPEGITSIGIFAFISCKSLSSITIPNSVTSIGLFAFVCCVNLKSISIPRNVTSISTDAFLGCSSLTNIVVESDNKVYDSRDNCNAIIKTDTNELVGGCKSTVIPDGITAIGSDVFRWSEITEITIPNSVQRIDDRAFDCSKITDVYFMGTEEQWNRILIGSDNSAFNNATIHYLAPDILGDADGNGTLDINDATLIQKHLASLETVSEDKLDLCDTDKDGYVSIKDVTLIQKYLVGLTESL